MTELLSDTSLWTLLGLILFIAILIYFGVHKTLTETLDKRAEAIRKEIEDAHSLREDAKLFLNKSQKRQAEAENEARLIIEQAHKQANLIKEAAEDEIRSRIERKTLQAEQRIAQARSQVEKEVKGLASDTAIEAAKIFFQQNLKSDDHDRMITRDIAATAKKLSSN